MCGLLLNQLNYIAYSIRGVVVYQKMNMVFVGFHSNDAIAFRITDIVYILLYIVSDRAFKYLLAVLRNKNYMHFKTILTPVMAIISVIHTVISLEAQGAASNV